VLTRDELSSNERGLLGSLFVTPVNVMATIGLLVGIMVVGLTVYTLAAERLRDFGVLKAIGASNTFLYAVIIRQALTIGSVGFLLGLSAGFVVKPVVEYFVPDLGIQYRPLFVAAVAGVSILISLLAAILPVYRITGVDPKQVFQA
jgi:putative ABC transport system permease protein